jgi:hypothetical protein
MPLLKNIDAFFTENARLKPADTRSLNELIIPFSHLKPQDLNREVYRLRRVVQFGTVKRQNLSDHPTRRFGKFPKYSSTDDFSPGFTFNLQSFVHYTGNDLFLFGGEKLKVLDINNMGKITTPEDISALYSRQDIRTYTHDHSY